MREIKFRAWDKSFKEMRQLIGFTYPNKSNIDTYTEDNSYRNMKEDTIIMQFTGLKDKNGKEIYEGDIIRYITPNGYKVIYKVQWNSGLCAFTVNDDEDYLNLVDEEKFEVIGNIYENPKLMKGYEE